MNRLLPLALIAHLLTPVGAIAYPQDPQTCNDKRNPHPTPNPPCLRLWTLA